MAREREREGEREQRERERERENDHDTNDRVLLVRPTSIYYLKLYSVKSLVYGDPGHGKRTL